MVTTHLNRGKTYVGMWEELQKSDGLSTHIVTVCTKGNSSPHCHLLVSNQNSIQESHVTSLKTFKISFVYSAFRNLK